MTNTAASVLREIGVDEESVVVVALPNDIRHVVAALGSWKLGSLVVPIDPDLAGAERDQLVSALGDVVVVDNAWTSLLDPDALLRNNSSQCHQMPGHAPFGVRNWWEHGETSHCGPKS